MKQIAMLRDELIEKNHPGQHLVQAAIDLSNSPEYIEGIARLLAEAARLDRVAEDRLIAELAKGLEG